MATVYTYPDAYLARFCTEEREERATADVLLMAASTPDGVFDSDWTERLVIVQTYILACIENQAKEDDLFWVKLKTYREQLSTLLPQAILAAAEAEDEISSVGFFSIPLERA